MKDHQKGHLKFCYFVNIVYGIYEFLWHVVLFLFCFWVQMMYAKKWNVGKEHANLLWIVLSLLNVSVIMVGRKLLIPVMMGDWSFFLASFLIVRIPSSFLDTNKKYCSLFYTAFFCLRINYGLVWIDLSELIRTQKYRWDYLGELIEIK
jgi:hypothetical protein